MSVGYFDTTADGLGVRSHARQSREADFYDATTDTGGAEASAVRITIFSRHKSAHDINTTHFDQSAVRANIRYGKYYGIHTVRGHSVEEGIAAAFIEQHNKDLIELDPISPVAHPHARQTMLLNVSDIGRGYTIAAQSLATVLLVIISSEVSSRTEFVSEFFLLVLLIGAAGLYLTGHFLRREFLRSIEQEIC